MLLTDYHLEMSEICRLLNEHEIPEAYAQAIKVKARLKAALKTLDVEVHVSPLGK